MLHSCVFRDKSTQRTKGAHPPADKGTSWLGIEVEYVVIFADKQNDVTMQRILAQHESINRDFNAENLDLAHVPSSGRYNFAKRTGCARIRFLPLTESSVRRVRVSRDDAIATRDQMREIAQPRSGCLTVAIAPLPAGTLGISVALEPFVCVESGTIGSQEYPGSPCLARLNTGRTLTHHIGHAFGLPHTFRPSCDPDSRFPDVPPQKLSNVDAFIVREHGVFSGTLDNHYRDCNGPELEGAKEEKRSCSNDCDSGYEMFMNFMDMGDDRTSLMFTASQVRIMRANILGSEALKVKKIVIGSKRSSPASSHTIDPPPSIVARPKHYGKKRRRWGNGATAAVVVCSLLLVAVLLALLLVRFT